MLLLCWFRSLLSAVPSCVRRDKLYMVILLIASMGTSIFVLSYHDDALFLRKRRFFFFFFFSRMDKYIIGWVVIEQLSMLGCTILWASLFLNMFKPFFCRVGNCSLLLMLAILICTFP
jgi:hypothetical protein